MRLPGALSSLILKVCRVGCLPSISMGKLFQCFSTLIVKDFSYCYYKSTLFQFKTIVPCPIATAPAEKLVPILLIDHQQVLEGLNEISLEPSLFWAEQLP